MLAEPERQVEQRSRATESGLRFALILEDSTPASSAAPSLPPERRYSTLGLAELPRSIHLTSAEVGSYTLPVTQRIRSSRAGQEGHDTLRPVVCSLEAAANSLCSRTHLCRSCCM